MATDTEMPIQIGTRYYMADLRGHRRGPIDSMRAMQDLSREPSDATFDNRGIWKRTQSDFILGAGQQYLDQEDESDRRRFRKSKGIDVWDRRKLTLLNSVSQTGTVGDGSTGAAVVTGTSIYMGSGNSIVRYNGSSWVACSGEAGSAITDLVVVGGFVYAAGGGTLKRVADGSTAFASYGSETPDVIGTGGGRLVGGDGALLYEIVAGGTKSDIYTHFEGSGFAWKKIVGAPNGIYCFGDDAGRSVGYLLTVVDATGELAPPYPVIQMPDGEFIRDVLFFGGVLVLATNLGVRLATINGSGFLTAGPLLEIGDVECLCTDGFDIWFGWTNYDASSTGLGRLRPSRFTDTFVPAYASDLMATDQGEVRACVSFNGTRHFLYNNSGTGSIQGEGTSKVASGTFYSGIISYGTPELLGAHSVEALWSALPAGANVQLEVAETADGTPVAGGIDNGTTDSTTEKGLLTNVLTAEEFEIVITLERGTDTTKAPELRRWTLRAIPLAYKTTELVLGLMLQSQVQYKLNGQAQNVNQDPYEEFLYLNGLMEARTIVDVVIGDRTEQMMIDYFGIGPDVEGVGVVNWTQDQSWLEGTWTVRLLSVEPT